MRVRMWKRMCVWVWMRIYMYIYIWVWEKYMYECENESISVSMREEPKARNLERATKCLHQIQWPNLCVCVCNREVLCVLEILYIYIDLYNCMRERYFGKREIGCVYEYKRIKNKIMYISVLLFYSLILNYLDFT